MKEWWVNLTLRDKRLLSIVGLVVLVFFLYEIFLAPISNYNNSLREEIERQKKLLTWMQATDSQIRNIQKVTHKQSSAKTSIALLSVLQKEINQSPLASSLTQLNQFDSNSVQLIFQKVNFDLLITWLSQLLEKEGLNVVQMTATSDGAIGVVDATIVLQ